MLVKIDTVKSPHERIKLVKKAIDIADMNNDIEWGFDLRRRIIEEERNTSSCLDSPPAFAWILKTHEHNPELCDESSFMMEYKWIVQAACRSASVSMQELDIMFEDYKRRILRSGYSLHSYYSAKTELAFQQNRLDEAKEYMELREYETRDEISCCKACETYDRLKYKFLSEDFVDVMPIIKQLFEEKKRCKYVTLKALATINNELDKYAYDYDTDDDDLYKLLEMELKKMKNTDMSIIGHIGKLIFFHTRRDKNRAWEMFEKYLPWSINCEDYYNFRFSSGSLSLFKGSGTRALNVGPEIPWHKPSGIYELSELYDYYYNQAATLAAKFDARNGCANFTVMLRSMD
jgi:hypothetical protein